MNPTLSSKNLNVLYEDNHLIAVEKPAGVLVQADETGDFCLMDVVKQYIKEKYNKTGNVFLGLVHRLDRPVSGIVLFAKTSKGASRLSEQFREHSADKIYHAWVEGNAPTGKSGGVRLKNWLVKDENRRKSFVYDKEAPGSQYAELGYRVIKNAEVKSPTGVVFPMTLLRVELETGRFHQIRAQLSHAGYPIVGDVKYGAKKAFIDGVIALFGTLLSFETATGGEMKTVQLPIPEVPVLDAFK